MRTRRVTWTSPAPTTEFGGGADIIGQSQSGNYSIVRISATAINRGASNSYSNYDGYHTVTLPGYGRQQVFSTLPAGVANGGVRWDLERDITVGHDANGNRGTISVEQSISGWFGGRTDNGSIGGFPRIPKRPSKPGTPVVSDILPTSVKLDWAASSDAAGSPITGYLVRYWPNAAGTGKYIDHSTQNNRSRVITGLNPGQEYRFVVYARNGSADNNGYSDVSGAVVVRTLSGAWVKWVGTWRRAAVFVKHGGLWKATAVFIKSGGTWRRGG